MINLKSVFVGASLIAWVATGVQSSAQDQGGNWEMTAAEFKTSDDPYQGWKVVGGSVAIESEPSAIVLTKEGAKEAGFYHYVPFPHVSEVTGPCYLQISASTENPTEGVGIGLVGNVSQGGGVLGRIFNGITTFNLGQQPYFTSGSSGKRNWALRFWGGASKVSIDRISQVRHLANGLTFEIVSQTEEGLPTEGDRVRIVLHSEQSDLPETVDAELVGPAPRVPARVEAWGGAGGPSVTLQKSGTGRYEAEITLDEETVKLLRSATPVQGARLGVRALVGEQWMTGWLYYPMDGQGETGKIDWQYREGEDTGSHQAWAELTKGEELARGKPLRYIPKPNYRLTSDDKDPYDLTDGKLAARKDDRIWFSRDAVGWYAVAGPIPMVTLLLDLEKTEPVGQIAIRLLAGKEQSGLRLPHAVLFYASEDGENFHRLKQMRKLMPAERALSDFKSNFYLAEEGTAFVHAFTCEEPVRARYIAIRVLPEASVFADEISVQRAGEGVPLKDLAGYPTETFYREGMVARFRQPELTLLEGVHLQNWVTLENYDSAPAEQLSLDIDLPARVRVQAPPKHRLEELKSEREGRRLYRVHQLETLDAQQRIPLYFMKEGTEPLGKGEQVYLTAIPDGTSSHRIAIPIVEREIEAGADFPGVDISLAWMHEATQSAWPDFFTGFRRLGFDSISTFPRNWHRRDTRQEWIASAKTEGESLIAQARQQGYRVVMNESPFHVMVHTFESAIKEGVLKPADGVGFYLTGVDGKPTKHPNPFYRGAFYQQEIERVRRLTAEVRPDLIFWDIERWWASVRAAKDDPAVAELWRESGKSWEDYVADCGAEMLRDLKNAVKAAMGDRPMPQIGLYGAYAAQKRPTDGLFHWDRIYPDLIDYAMPSLYVSGRTGDVRDRIRGDYPLIGRQSIPWLTAGTYGPVDPPSIESMIWETLLNGARGVTYYEYRDFDPLHFYYHARALSTLAKFPDLMKAGQPNLSYQGDNDSLSYTCFATEDEALILVGNYRRSPETKATLALPFSEGVTRQVLPGEGFGPEVSASQLAVEVPAGTYILYHQKRADAQR